MEKNSGIVTILKMIGVVGGLYLFYLFYTKTNSNLSAYEQNYIVCVRNFNTEYSGKILNNFFSRGTYMSYLSSKQIFVCYCRTKVQDLYYEGDSLVEWELFDVGDSIYKPAKTFDFYLFKQANPDSVIFVECNYDCEINLRGQVEAPELKIKSTTRYVTSQVLSKVTFEWDFNKEHEKYINGFRIVKENLDNTKDTSELLMPDVRHYSDSIFPVPENLDVFNGKYVYFQYKLVVIIEGIRDKESYPVTIVPYIDWEKAN